MAPGAEHSAVDSEATDDHRDGGAGRWEGGPSCGKLAFASGWRQPCGRAAEESAQAGEVEQGTKSKTNATGSPKKKKKRFDKTGDSNHHPLLAIKHTAPPTLARGLSLSFVVSL